MTTRQTNRRGTLDLGANDVDAASLHAFRFAYGVVCFVLVVRYFLHGWIREYFLDPTYHFSFWGLGFLRPLGSPLIYIEFAVLAVAALGIAWGRHLRFWAFVFWVLFTHQHFSEKTIYLNHYYLVSLVAFLMLWLPIGRDDGDRVPRWVLWAMRLQIGLVYFYGGVGKLNGDWLWRAQPLQIWLLAKSDAPLVGGVLEQRWLAYAMSWAGAIFDLTIPAFLLARRTRPYAFVAVIGFHLVTGWLFPIGIFPWLMPFGATLFFDPSWPRKFRFFPLPSLGPARPAMLPVRVMLAVHFALQVTLPLRSLLYPGNVNWTEEGFRFSWKVMLVDKAGHVDYRIVSQSGRKWLVNPANELTPYQVKMLSTQPDMIAEYARHLREKYAAIAGEPVAVYADATVAYDGRMRAWLIDRTVDLGATEDGLGHQRFITLQPDQPAQ